MKSLVAKPVVKDQYWIVTDGNHKVGNVIADGRGYEVKLNGVVEHCANTADIMREYDIEFERRRKSNTANHTPYAVWPTNSKTYNNVLDIKRKLHLYTKTKSSKCYYAAGYFNIQMNGEWQTVHCPKYIFIQRYPYNGPYKSESEAALYSEATQVQKTINTT
jgi:hypothetical protein